MQAAKDHRSAWQWSAVVIALTFGSLSSSGQLHPGVAETYAPPNRIDIANLLKSIDQTDRNVTLAPATSASLNGWMPLQFRSILAAHIRNQDFRSSCLDPGWSSDQQSSEQKPHGVLKNQGASR